MGSLSPVRSHVENPSKGRGTEGAKLPPYVTFKTGAELLVRLDIDVEATGDSVRRIARDSPDWPFGEDGDGKPHSYVHIGNARTMETGVFLDYFREHPRTGRGRDRQPRRKRSESQ